MAKLGSFDMSRIYDNKPLNSIPVENHSLSASWESITKSSGNGIVLEAIIDKRSRHVITDAANKKYRYVVFHVRPKFILKRKFNAQGDEVEPNFDLTQKVNTGYLHSSYKTEAKGTSDKISQAEADRLVSKPSLNTWTQKYCTFGALSFWIEEKELDPLEVEDGDKVRIKTKGDGPFIYSISKIEVETKTISNAAGVETQVGESWTDKIMGMKGQDQLRQPEESAKTEGDGAEDDEWDD